MRLESCDMSRYKISPAASANMASPKYYNDTNIKIPSWVYTKINVPSHGVTGLNRGLCQNVAKKVPKCYKNNATWWYNHLTLGPSAYGLALDVGDTVS